MAKCRLTIQVWYGGSRCPFAKVRVSREQKLLWFTSWVPVISTVANVNGEVVVNVDQGVRHEVYSSWVDASARTRTARELIIIPKRAEYTMRVDLG